MKPVPRLLPLTAVAIGGVLAVKALAGIEALPQLMAGAKAMAEEAPGHAARAAASPPKSSPLPDAAPKPVAAPACAQSPTEIAKEAGLSPGELQTLQNLSTRRGQLDGRQRALDTQLQLIAAAEVKVDGKMKALNALKAEIQGLLGQQSQQEQAEVDRLVIVYSKMKPRDAAAIMATLDDRVRIPVAAKMKERNLADILAQMPTVEAKKVTEELAGRLKPQTLSDTDPATPPPVGAGAAAGPQVAAKPAVAGPVQPAPDQLANIEPDAPAPHHPARKPEPRKHAAAHARADTPTMKAARPLALKSLAARAPAPAPVKPPVQSASAAPRPALPKPPAAAVPVRPALPAPTAASTAG